MIANEQKIPQIKKNNDYMNQLEFVELSNSLSLLSTKIPLRWGYIQNNRYDDAIDMFSISNYGMLESAIQGLSDEHKNYLRRRWYLWKCSECDEYLFYMHNNVTKNPNRYDKSWDICIDNNYYFDIKGTVIPKSMRNDVPNILNNPFSMIKFYYDFQSRGRRYDSQNRLFIVHHSFVDENREFYLRCAWSTKVDLYSKFINGIRNVTLYNYGGNVAGVIFLIENLDNTISSIIPGLV